MGTPHSEVKHNTVRTYCIGCSRHVFDINFENMGELGIDWCYLTYVNKVEIR